MARLPKTGHVLTRSYLNLKGFSTDSIFFRPPNVSENTLNMMRGPDGTFSTRRGFQADAADIGGLGNVVYDSPFSDSLEIITLHRDGNLYRLLDREVRITYSTSGFTPTPNLFFDFTIFTDPSYVGSGEGWDLLPWGTMVWGAPSSDSITFKGYLRWSATVNGNQTGVDTVNVNAGHLVVVGDVAYLYDFGAKGYVERTVILTTPTSITFNTSSSTAFQVTVQNGQQIDLLFTQPFFKGYDVSVPYPISQFVSFLNSIGTPPVRSSVITAYATGLDNVPAAFIPIQEDTIILNGNTAKLTYNYWEILFYPKVGNPLLPGSASIVNQNSSNFENATFAVFEDVVYCSNGYDFPVKYDGQTAYIAGVPPGDKPSVVDGGADPTNGLPAGTYDYATSYTQVDNTGRSVESSISSNFVYTAPGGDQARVTVVDILNTSGYNTDCAKSQSQTSTSRYGPDVNGFYYYFVTLKSGMTLRQGDTAYYKNQLSGQVVLGTANSQRLGVNPGTYDIKIGDTIYFTDNTGVNRIRTVQDIDTTSSPNFLEIGAPPVDVSNNPTIQSYREDVVYGDIAIVNGDQSNVTSILAKTGHTIAIGDEIFFLNNQNNLEIRTVIATDATHVTFSSIEPASVLDKTLIYSNTISNLTIALQKTPPLGSVQLFNNQIISNNLRINIYRSKINPGSPPELFLLESIPNDSFDSIFVYTDDTLDSELSFEFIPPQRTPAPPPKAKYILTYQNLLIYAGGDRNSTSNEFSRDRFYFSQGDEPENVPSLENNLLVPGNNDEISGVGICDGYLIIFKDASIYSISGDLLTNQAEVNAIAPGSNIGCAAHATIQSIGNLLYFLHTNGVYSMSQSQLFPTDKLGNYVPLSFPIDVLFREQPFDPSKRFVLKRATAINYAKDQQYLLFLPCEDSTTPIRDANANSMVLCYDYIGKNWFNWNNVNAAGGFLLIGDNLYWQERRFSTFVSDTANLYRQHRHYRLIDYADHADAIGVSWLSSWEDLGEPEVRKKFVRVMLLMDRISQLYQVNLPEFTFTTYRDRIPGLVDTQAVVTQSNQTSTWNYSSWGWSQWGGLVDSFIRINVKHSRATKSQQIGFTLKQLNTSFKFQGFQLEVSPDFERSFLR